MRYINNLKTNKLFLYVKPATILFLWLCSFFFLMFTGGKLAFMIFIIITLISIYLWLGKFNGITNASGQRIISQQDSTLVLEANSKLSMKLEVKIPGFWPIPYVLVTEVLQRKNGEKHSFESSFIPDWRRKGDVSYTIPSLRRGYYYFEQTECSTKDIFGIMEHKSKMKLPFSFRILPKMITIHEWLLLHQIQKGYQQQANRTGTFRESTQINGVREYTYGDRLSRIHWNATAKTGTLKSKEFEREAIPKTILIIDRKKSSYTNDKQFELAVSTAASISKYGEQMNVAIGLLSHGEKSQYFEPQKGKVHYTSIRNHLIDVETDSDKDIYQVIQQRAEYLGSGSFVVLISPVKGERMLQILQWLKQRQINACHIWLASEEESAFQDIWVKQIKAKGFHCYPINKLDNLPKLLKGGHG